MIYFAPLQGFTDFVYRKAYAEFFTSVDAFFIPYISIKNNLVLNKYKKDILRLNNPQKRVVPQVLPKDKEEFLSLSKFLEDEGYNEINLNLGCPYPMVTNRGKGAGLLPYPEKIGAMLSGYFSNCNLQISVKLRAGLLSANEIEKVIPVLNQFPLKEVIFHPRIAKQLYSGQIAEAAFQFAAKNLNHTLVYNGDILSVEDFKKYSRNFPGVENWMIGRGILMNPFLPDEINGVYFPENEKWEKLWAFHQRIFELQSETMDNEGNVLNKMKQFWSYFSFNFHEQKKHLKLIQKAKTRSTYLTVATKLFRGPVNS